MSEAANPWCDGFVTAAPRRLREPGSAGARQARNDLKAVFGYVVMMAALIITMPSLGCAQQPSSIGGKAGADEALSEQD